MRHHLLSKSFIAAVLMLAVRMSEAYEGSSYDKVKKVIFDKPYKQLPQYKVSKKLFGKPGRGDDNYALKAAKRTLAVADDFWQFPQQQKLFQANGICFAGEWRIDKPSPYTGQFRNLTRSRVIARASVALSGTKRADKRAFGMAVKLFPEKDSSTVAPTLNAFVMHTMGGTRTDHVLNLVMDNEPPLGSVPPLSSLGVGYRLLKDFNTADKLSGARNPDVGYRPVDHLAIEKNGINTVAPTWLRLRALPGLPRIDEDDFRDELRVEHYPEQQLTWLIEVASGQIRKKSRAQWLTIGRLVVNESIISPACDQLLHFAHPLLDSP